MNLMKNGHQSLQILPKEAARVEKNLKSPVQTPSSPEAFPRNQAQNNPVDCGATTKPKIQPEGDHLDRREAGGVHDQGHGNLRQAVGKGEDEFQHDLRETLQSDEIFLQK